MIQNNDENKKIECNICKTENIKDTHYCINCGNNLSDLTEITDVLFFITKLINVIAIFFFVSISISVFGIVIFVKLLGGNVIKTYINVLLPFAFIFLGNYLLKRYTIKRCKRNLSKNNGGK